MAAGQSISILNLGGSINDGSRAFALQYTALMLTILSFVVGAFASHKIGQSESKQQSSIYPVASQEVYNREEGTALVLSNLNYDDLFNDNLIEPNLTARASALSTILSSHDLKLKGEIGISDREIQDRGTRLESAMLRVRVLTDYLISQGVPEHAIELFAVDSEKVPQANLKIVKARKYSALQPEEGVYGEQ